MASLLAYKAALLILLAGIPTSVGASVYYNQQQTNSLNNHISDLGNKLDNANSQVSNINNQVSNLNSQLSQVQSQNLQLQNQISSLQSQLASLNRSSQNQATVVSKGQVSLMSNNGFQSVSFTVPPNVIQKLNLTYSTSSQGCLGAFSQYTPCSLGASLFNQTQFDTFSRCNCVLYGNYTASTWSSPLATSYASQVEITSPGVWFLAFYPEPGAGNPVMILVNETVLLTGPLNLKTQTSLVSSGIINLSGFGSTQYVPFTVSPGIFSSSLNFSFTVSGGYSARLALLDQAQYNVFLTCNCVFYGNYTASTWFSPIVQSYTAPVTIPNSGNWYLVFMEPPGTGSGLTITETAKLTVVSS